MDFAKRLLDFGMHSPTTYFPLLIPECFLVEPTETETRAELDAYADALVAIRDEAERQILSWSHYRAHIHCRCVRLDDVKAARELDLAWRSA